MTDRDSFHMSIKNAESYISLYWEWTTNCTTTSSREKAIVPCVGMWAFKSSNGMHKEFPTPKQFTHLIKRKTA
jgi:hypothetical protein